MQVLKVEIGGDTQPLNSVVVVFQCGAASFFSHVLHSGFSMKNDGLSVYLGELNLNILKQDAKNSFCGIVKAWDSKLTYITGRIPTLHHVTSYHLVFIQSFPFSAHVST